MPSPVFFPYMHICHLIQRHTKYIAKRVSDCILLLSWLINMTKYIEKIDRFAYGSFHCILCFILCARGCIWLYMLLLCRWDGFSLLWFGLLRLLSGYLGCNLWPSWANIRLSKPLLLVKTVKNTSNNMDRFAYSLQDVLSYFIWSPRCLYDGSKVAYGGREWPGTSPDGAKFASRWFHVDSRWGQDVPSLAFGSHIRFKK